MQAFIADDCGLIERLIRFDQAHDLLKNVGRVQKLAQDSTAALEMYQRQVRTLEEQLVLSDGFYGPSSRLRSKRARQNRQRQFTRSEK